MRSADRRGPRTEQLADDPGEAREAQIYERARHAMRESLPPLGTEFAHGAGRFRVLGMNAIRTAVLARCVASGKEYFFPMLSFLALCRFQRLAGEFDRRG